VSGAAQSPGVGCIGEPVSWLRLERYHLGEVDGDERRPIADHLAACVACSACLARIREDDATPLPSMGAARPTGGRGLTLLPGGALASLAALAAAAALVLGLRGSGTSEVPARGTAPMARIKGGAVAFSLVRDDGERVEGSLGVYRDGDRFKAIVTCPPGGGVGFDVVVREGARESFPLPPAVDLTCGNEVPLPGAFQLTGSADETVCLVWNETGVVDRSANAQVGDRPSLCKRLSAAPHQ